MPVQVGALLRGRRRELKLLPDDVAKLAQLKVARIREIEAGGRSASIRELERLGRALAFDPADIVTEGSLKDPRRLPGWFQSHQAEQELGPHDTRLLLLAGELGRIGGFLLRELDDRGPRLFDFREPHDVVDAIADGKESGSSMRNRLQPQRPIDSMQHLLEDLDVHVARVRFRSTTSAAVSILQVGGMPIVLLNESNGRADYVPARRMTLAHELGHLLLDGGEQELGGRSLPRASEVETRANNFAPNFLAPRPLVLDALESELGSVEADAKPVCLQIARYWGLSLSGAAHHAANVGVMSKEAASVIESDAEWRKANAETLAIERWEEPQDRNTGTLGLVEGLAERIVLRARDSGIITTGRAREILRLG